MKRFSSLLLFILCTLFVNINSLFGETIDYACPQQTTDEDTLFYFTFTKQLIDTCGATGWWNGRHNLCIDIPEYLEDDSLLFDLSFSVLDDWYSLSINEWHINSNPICIEGLNITPPFGLEGSHHLNGFDFNIYNTQNELVFDYFIYHPDDFDYDYNDFVFELLELPFLNLEDGIIPTPIYQTMGVFKWNTDTITACLFEEWIVPDFCHASVDSELWPYTVQIPIHILYQDTFSTYDLFNEGFSCSPDCSLPNIIEISADEYFSPLPELADYSNLKVKTIGVYYYFWDYPIEEVGNCIDDCLESVPGSYVSSFNSIPVKINISEISIDTLATQTECFFDTLLLTIGDDSIEVNGPGMYYPSVVTSCNTKEVIPVNYLALPELSVDGNIYIIDGEPTYLVASNGFDLYALNSIANNDGIPNIFEIEESGTYTISAFFDACAYATSIDIEIIDSFTCITLAEETVLPIIESCGELAITIDGEMLNFEEAGDYEYEQVFQNQYGCDSVVVYPIQINEQPIVTINGGIDVIDVVDTNAVELMVDGVFETYSWAPNDGFVYFTQSIVVGESADYEVTVVDENGCTNTANVSVNFYVLGLNAASSFDISIYPNPFEDVLFIDVLPVDFIEISIYDQLGKCLYHFTENQKTIDTQNWSAGVYLVGIKMVDGSVLVKKVLKE